MTKNKYAAYADGKGFFKVVDMDTGRVASFMGLHLSGIGTRETARQYAAELNVKERLSNRRFRKTRGVGRIFGR